MSDIRIHETGDGGDFIAVESGDLKVEDTLFSAVYLSIFEGHTYYGFIENDDTDNVDIEELLNQTVNISNLGALESAIDKKLQWLMDESICSSIKTSAKSGLETGSISIEILITEADGNSQKFALLWNQQMKELRYYKVIK